MKISLTLFCLLALPLAALAVTDPTPDVMGFYFDGGANTVEYSCVPFTPIHAYLVLTNPTESVISGFEFGYHHWVQPGFEDLFLRLETNFPPGVIIIVDPSTPLDGSYSISMPDPVPAAQAVVLMSWVYMLLDDIAVHLNLGPADDPTFDNGLPAYWGPGRVVPAGLAQTCFGTGARVNEFCPLSEERHSFGRVKSLYR